MLILSAILESLSTLKDRTVKIVFYSQELTVEQVSELYKNIQNFVVLAIKSDMFKTQEKKILEDIKIDYEDKGKSKAQRLRAVLYRFWEQDKKGFETNEQHYDYQMEKLINHFKDKLE